MIANCIILLNQFLSYNCIKYYKDKNNYINKLNLDDNEILVMTSKEILDKIEKDNNIKISKINVELDTILSTLKDD